MDSSVCFHQATGSAGSQEERQVMDPPNYISFLIRLWREPNSELPEQTAGWQGEVEHIQSGRRWKSSILYESLDFLRRQVTALESGWQVAE
jgi:hypothetical protein